MELFPSLAANVLLLAGEKDGVWKFPRDLKAQPPKLDYHFRSQPRSEFRVITEISRQAAIFCEILKVFESITRTSPPLVRLVGGICIVRNAKSIAG